MIPLSNSPAKEQLSAQTGPGDQLRLPFHETITMRLNHMLRRTDRSMTDIPPVTNSRRRKRFGMRPARFAPGRLWGNRFGLFSNYCGVWNLSRSIAQNSFCEVSRGSGCAGTRSLGGATCDTDDASIGRQGRASLTITITQRDSDTPRAVLTEL